MGPHRSSSTTPRGTSRSISCSVTSSTSRGVAGTHMTGRGSGAIVAIASVSGLRSAPLHGPYGAAKAGLMSLVRTLAVELAA